jgi:hypothetical protein
VPAVQRIGLPVSGHSPGLHGRPETAFVISRTQLDGARLHNSLMRKSDHDDSTYFRSRDRVFCQNGRWFYQTREDDHGPFPTREAAELDLKRYVDEMAFFQNAKGDTPTELPSLKDPGFANFSLVDKD